MRVHTLLMVSGLFFMILAAGCHTPPRDVYTDWSEPGIASPGVDPYDYVLVYRKMIASMVSRVGKPATPPVVTFGPFVNNTDVPIHTHMMLEHIRAEAMKSGAVRFSAATDYRRTGGESGEIYKQLEFQNESGHVNPATVKRYGEIHGADYVLYGNIYSIGRTGGGMREANYSYVLTLHEIGTGLVVWSDTREIRKNIPMRR